MRVVMFRKINMMLVHITKNIFFTICFWYTVIFRGLEIIVPEGNSIDTFLNNILSSIPSKVAGYLGIVYGLVVVFKKVSSAWKSHETNRYDVKMARENFKQKEIETQRKRRELEELNG